MRVVRFLLAFVLGSGLLVACATIPRGFELTPDEVLLHPASGTAFPAQIGAFSRGSPFSYNSEGTDVSVHYQAQTPWPCSLDMYVYPASTPNGPIGMRNQHSDFVETIVRMHPGAVVNSDSDAQVDQAGERFDAKETSFTYRGSLGGPSQALFSLLVEFEYRRWFVSYRMDVPATGRDQALDVLLDFVRQAPLPTRDYAPGRADFYALVWNGTPESVQAAIDAGADINAPDNTGRTPLMYAAGYSQVPEVVAVLLKAGAEVNATMAGNGVTPLMFAAAANRSPEVITMLLDAGADLAAKSQGGATVLMWAAVYSENSRIVEVLLDAGADATAEDDSGRSAFDLAGQNSRIKGTDAFQRLQEAVQ